MKIAILNWRDLENPRAGGAEVFVHEVAMRWVERGHEVVQFSSRVPGMPSRGVCDGVEIRRVGWLMNGTHHALAPRRVRKGGFDAVFESVNTVPYFLPARKGSPPFVTLVHQMARDIWSHELPALAPVMRWIEPLSLRPYRDSPVLAISESSKTDLLAAGLRSVEVVPQGGLGPRPAIPKADRPTLLFVGRLTPNKRPLDAVATFALVRERMPDARLLIVGTGSLADELQSSLPPGVELVGRVSRAELLGLMGSSHLLLVPSVREGWGLVVTEANALGTPAVGYRVPGLVDSIRDGETGIVVDPDPCAMAHAALSLLDADERYQRMVSAARAWGGSFSWTSTADVLYDAMFGDPHAKSVSMPRVADVAGSP